MQDAARIADGPNLQTVSVDGTQADQDLDRLRLPALAPIRRLKYGAVIAYDPKPRSAAGDGRQLVLGPALLRLPVLTVVGRMQDGASRPYDPQLPMGDEGPRCTHNAEWPVALERLRIPLYFTAFCF